MNVGFKAQYFKELSQLEANNFWFKSRNKIIVWALQNYCQTMTTFLEIGCGTGFVLTAIAQRFPLIKLSGSEFLEEGLIYARQRLPQVEFATMDARQIAASDQFDAIGAFDVIEHIEEDEIVLQQIHKALKHGGIALITVPQHRWLWSAADEYACHVRRYTAKELHQKLTHSGFEIVRSTSFVSTLLPAMIFSRLLQPKKVTSKVDEMAELRINPTLNALFESALNLELACIRNGINFSFGGSRLVVARKI